MTSPEFTATGYEPRFDIDYRAGKVGEALVGTFLQSLTEGTIEVKTERNALKYGNHFVETHQQRSDQQWYPSGINTTESDWWVIASPTGAGFIAIRRQELLQLVLESERREQPINNEHTNAARGRVVPLLRILRALFHNPDAENQP